jgi:hypothetical protein
MKRFSATIDKKYEVWQRIDISFEAKDEAEANALLEKWDGLPPEDTSNKMEYLNTETLYDTEEAMTKEENGGQPIWELQDISEE